MDSSGLRPSFTIPLAVSRERAIEHMRDRLNESVPDRWIGMGRWAEIHVPGSQRELWSPHLSLRIDSDSEAEERCSVFARFAPRPEIWTGLVFAYSAAAFAALFGATLGYVQWASDESAWGLWLPAAAIPTMLGIHIAGAIGRRLSREQMHELQDRLHSALEEIRDDGPISTQGTASTSEE